MIFEISFSDFSGNTNLKLDLTTDFRYPNILYIKKCMTSDKPYKTLKGNMEINQRIGKIIM